MLVLAASAALTLVVAPAAPAGEISASFLWFVHPVTVPFFLAAFWGVEIWRAEGPDHRSHVHGLPVGQLKHEALRVLAGACWLGLGLVIWTVPLTLFDSWASFGGLNLHRWLGVLEGPLLLYCAATVIAMWSRRPGSLIVLGAIAYFVLFMTLILTLGAAHPFVSVWGWPWVGDGGFSMAVFGGLRSESMSGGPIVPAWTLAMLIWWALCALVMGGRARVLPD